MLHLDIIAVGRLKESYWREAAAEYLRRLGAYARVEIIELADEPLPARPGESGEREALEREAERILASIEPGSRVVALDRQGKKVSSEGLAALLDRWAVQGQSRISFIIGGGAGLSPAVTNRASDRISFSDLTFPHQMMRVILLEQLYRAFKISRNEAYHR